MLKYTYPQTCPLQCQSSSCTAKPWHSATHKLTHFNTISPSLRTFVKCPVRLFVQATSRQMRTHNHKQPQKCKKSIAIPRKTIANERNAGRATCRLWPNHRFSTARICYSTSRGHIVPAIRETLKQAPAHRIASCTRFAFAFAFWRLGAHFGSGSRVPKSAVQHVWLFCVSRRKVGCVCRWWSFLWNKPYNYRSTRRLILKKNVYDYVLHITHKVTTWIPHKHIIRDKWRYILTPTHNNNIMNIVNENRASRAPTHTYT